MVCASPDLCPCSLQSRGSHGNYIRSSSTTFIGKASPKIKPTTVSTFDAVPPELHKSLLHKAAEHPVGHHRIRFSQWAAHGLIRREGSPHPRDSERAARAH
jgi:hypothetical protein